MEENTIKPNVLDYEDICELAPFFKGKRKLVNFLFKMLKMDKVNWLHSHNCSTPGAPFTKGVLKDLNATVVVENEKILDNLPEGTLIESIKLTLHVAEGRTYGVLSEVFFIDKK